VISVIGAGAMGAALAIVHARAGLPTALLGTRFDDATIEACRSGRPHPALGVTLDGAIDCRRHGAWGGVLPNAERVVLAVSSDGLADVASEVAAAVSQRARARVVWTVATKGWDADTLRTPSEVLRDVLGHTERVVILGGPALAPEIVASVPTAMVCASTDAEVGAVVASTLGAAGVSASVTDDVAGVEIAAAYKNVTAIAVGMCEGLSERRAEAVYIHRFANARAAMFARGLEDMWRLADSAGGRLETIMGLAGAGDLYVTCLGGRNGTFGRLLGSGQTPEQAQATIGSTVEGVANTKAALEIADRQDVELAAARAVNTVLSGEASPEEAIGHVLSS
jgi:glycerol-3-phosphate dehydrogenase (NAD(P)+)